MKISDTLRQEHEPSFAYAICKMVSENTLSKNELISVMTNDNQEIITKNIKFVEDCEFVVNDGQHIKCLIPTESMKTYSDFIEYISLKVFEEENNFTKLTRWFLSANTDICDLQSEEFAAKCYEVVNVDQNFIRGWHWWMIAFGLGTLSAYIKSGKRTIMFDCSEALKRFVSSEYKNGEIIKVRTFLAKLVDVKKEFKGVINLNNNYNQLCESLSLSLRILHNLNIIELIYTPDSLDVWHLTESYSHKIKKDITEIKIVGC